MTVQTDSAVYAERRARWVEALRSGEYKQALGYLRRTLDSDELDFSPPAIGHCCLGVACDLVPEEIGRWEAAGGPVPGVSSFMLDEHYGEAYQLPPRVAEWYGFTVTNTYGEPVLRSDDIEKIDTLVNANDGGEDFNHIADLIESMWPESDVSASGR